MIYIEDNELIPADIVALISSLDTGVCYLETSSLDGEKNLKAKTSVSEI